MSFYRVGDRGVIFAAAPRSVTFGASSVAPALTVGYVDTSGTRQTLSVVDNVTTITGVAPFFVDFDGSASVSAQADSNTPEEAFWNLGFLIDYGEALGGTWSVSGRPRDTDRGLPIFAHCYTTAGTFSARMTCRDSAGNQAFVRVNVVVTAPGAGVDMTSGVLPTFASGTVYNAPAGGTWGAITNQLDGLHNVIIRKTGAGADPVFGSVTLDSRNSPTTAITRTRGIRFLNCDVANVTSGWVGYDYCAFVNGRVRQIEFAPMQFAGGQVFALGMTLTQAQNVRYARGLMLQNTGELGDGNADAYNVIGEVRGLHLKNVTSVKTSTAQHNIRGNYSYSSFRHVLLNNTASGSVSYFKLQGLDCRADVSLPTQTGTPDAWPDNDMAVNYGAGRVLGLPLTHCAVVDFRLGASGGSNPVTNASVSPENNDAAAAQGVELSGFEHGTYFQATEWFTIDLQGRNVGRRDVTLDSGSGAAVGVRLNAYTNRVPAGWEGPYFNTGSRPVVVP
jgi:hypothetical protein